MTVRRVDSSFYWQSEWDKYNSSLLEGKPRWKIHILHPEVVGTMMSKFVLYNVRTEPMSLSVKRRFSDFVLLRDVLIQRYPGMFIPSLPSSSPFSVTKTMVSGSNTDINSEFVKSRMFQLNLFIQELCRIPFLLVDASFEAFISLQDDFKGYIESSSKVLANSQSPGVQAWKSILESIAVGNDVDRIINSAKKQIESIRHVLRQYETQCLAIEKHAIANAKEVSTLSNVTSAWSVLEAELADPSKTETPNTHYSDMRNNLKILSGAHEIWSQHSLVIPKLISVAIIANIQFQTNQLDGFREFLQYRETLTKDLAKAEKDVVKALEEKSRTAVGTSSSSGFASLFGSVPLNKEENYLKKVEMRDYLQSAVDYVTRGLLFSEVDRFNQDRCRYLTSLVGALVAVNKYMTVSFANKWTDLASQGGIVEDDSQFEELIRIIMSGKSEDSSLVDG